MRAIVRQYGARFDQETDTAFVPCGFGSGRMVPALGALTNKQPQGSLSIPQAMAYAPGR